MDMVELQTIVLNALSAVTKKKLGADVLDSSYLELGVDSLDMVILVDEIEQLLDIDIDPESIFEFHSINDFLEFICSEA